MLVVEDDAGEVAVHSVVQVQHVVGRAQSGIGDSAASNDVARNGERSGDVVTSRLANDTDVWREVLIQRSRQHRSHRLKSSVAGKTATNIQGVHVEAKGSRLVEDEAGVLDGLDEGLGVRCARADVESYAYNVEPQFLCKLKQLASLVHCSTELLAQTAQAGRVVGDDTQVQLSIREKLLGFVELVGVVKSHLLDTSVGGVADVRLCLAGLRVDYARGVDAHVENHLNLVLGGAVEAESKLSHEAQDLQIWVALDRYPGVRECITMAVESVAYRSAA